MAAKRKSGAKKAVGAGSKKRPAPDFLSGFSRPAARALHHAGITSAKELSKRTEKEVLSLHGMGPASLPALHAALKAAKLTFRAQ